MNGLKESVESVISENYRKTTSGLSICIYRDGEQLYRNSVGEIETLSFHYTDDTIYDLASLTKPIITTTITGKLIERGKISLEDNLGSLGFIDNTNLSNITIRSLLSHSTGLIWHYPLYEHGHNKESYIETIKLLGEQSKIYNHEEYSDLNFILLGFLLEHIYGKSLDKIAEKEIIHPLGLKNTGFNLTRESSMIAPTENTKDRGLLHGKVHDENSYYLGGVAGHAGLFSNIEDLSIFMKSLLDGKLLNNKTLELFTSPQNQYLGGTYGLGWMVKTKKTEKPSPSYGLSLFMGDYAPIGTFGHTGFTGTSIVANREMNMFSILLTNRVYPTRENVNILRFRRLLNNAIFLNI